MPVVLKYTIFFSYSQAEAPREALNKVDLRKLPVKYHSTVVYHCVKLLDISAMVMKLTLKYIMH